MQTVSLDDGVVGVEMNSFGGTFICGRRRRRIKAALELSRSATEGGFKIFFVSGAGSWYSGKRELPLEAEALFLKDKAEK